MNDQSPIYLIGNRVYLRPSRILQVIRDPEYPEDPDPEVYRRATRLGVKLHAAIQAHLLTGAVRQSQLTTPEARMGWLAYTRWKQDAQPLIREVYGQSPVELLIHAPSVGVACRLDLWDQKGCGYLTDWKFKRQITRKDRMKLNANWFILQEWWEQQDEPGVSLPDKLRLVKFDKAMGEYQEVPMDPDKGLWQTFLHLKEGYRDLYDLEIQGAVNERGQDGSGDDK